MFFCPMVDVCYSVVSKIILPFNLLIIQDSCSWSYDKTYDIQSRPRVTFSTSGRHISMSHSLPCVIC